MKEEITNAQLFRFCAGETTVKENDRIAAWLDENPEEHQQRLNDVPPCEPRQRHAEQ